MMAMHPWILALVTSSQQIKMVGQCQSQFLSSFDHNYYWNTMSLCSKNCFKIKFVDLCIYIPGNKATGKQIFQLLVSEMVDSQQWRISPNNGRLDFTRCRRFDFKVTYYCSNHLKLMLCIGERSLYEIILSVVIKFLLFSHSSTPKLAKLLQGQQLFPVVY